MTTHETETQIKWQLARPCSRHWILYTNTAQPKWTQSS